MKIHWATDYMGIGNSYGYSIHNRIMKKEISKYVEFDENAKISLAILQAYNYERVPDKFNVLFTMWETEDLPRNYVEGLKQADFIIVPCEHNKKLHQKYVDKPIEVCQEGCDTEIFKYKKREFPQNGKPFRFLWVGAPNPRKGYEEMAFICQMVKDVPGIEIYLKTTMTDRFEVRGNVIFDSRNISIEEMVNLYHSAHCFVLPSRGEGWGLCVDGETLINLIDGVKKIKDIEIGDYVLSENGEFNIILNKIQRIARVLKIEIMGSPPIYVTPEHPFLVLPRWKKRITYKKHQSDKPEWKAICMLQKGDLIAYPRPKLNKSLPPIFDLSQWANTYDENFVWEENGYSPQEKEYSIRRMMNLYGVSKSIIEKAIASYCGKRKIPKANSKIGRIFNELKRINFICPQPVKINRYIPVTDDFLWIVGLYLAEGSSEGGKRVTWSLSKAEEDKAQKIIDIAQNLFGIIPKKNYKKNNVLEIRMASTILASFFEWLCGKGAHDKRIHPILMESGKFLGALVRGYIEGDGSKIKLGYSFTTVSSNLIWQLRLVLSGIGVHLNVKKSDKRNIWVGNICGDAVLRLHEWCNLPIDHIQPSKRKRTESAIVRDDFIYVPIRKILEDNEREVFDIQVEGVNSFTGNGILLHNTLIEAMSTGLPCIAPRHTGMADFFDDYVGYTVKWELKEIDLPHYNLKTSCPFPDPFDIFHRMVYVVKNYKEALQKGKKASERVRNKFTWEKAGLRLYEILKEVERKYIN